MGVPQFPPRCNRLISYCTGEFVSAIVSPDGNPVIIACPSGVSDRAVDDGDAQTHWKIKRSSDALPSVLLWASPPLAVLKADFHDKYLSERNSLLLLLDSYES